MTVFRELESARGRLGSGLKSKVPIHLARQRIVVCTLDFRPDPNVPTLVFTAIDGRGSRVDQEFRMVVN
jgi:hypothetical protein